MIRRAARTLALLGYFLLCVRFLYTTAAAAASPLAFGVLAGGAGLAAAWSPLAAFEAFLVLLPLVFALGRAGMIGFGAPEMVVFACFSLVLIVRRLLWWRPGNGSAGEGIDPTKGWEAWLLLAADLLAAWTLLSLLRWLPTLLGDPARLKAFGSQPVFGFSDRLFPVTDTLIWLMGWFFLRLLLVFDDGRRNRGSWATPDGGVGERCLLLSLLSWAVWTPVFFLIQICLNLPDRFTYETAFAAPTSMFNDPHSMGSVSAALALGLLAASAGLAVRARVGAASLALGLLALVAVCYSRAAWLAACMGLVLFLFSVRPRLAVVFIGLVSCAAGAIAWRADDLLKLNWRYATRVVQFVRPGHLSDYHEARFEIYRRAPGMLAAHPLLGHGPGSSRVASEAFVAAGDRWGRDFMHNTVLQAAVEQGIPAGVLFAALLLLPLALAARRWRKVCEDPVALGSSVALFTYLITQMSSNSLNVYLDQQLFYWSLT
ncbi:MAG TPA: O-antigen ligase family protein, partial [Opitutaceae bacterium]